MSADLAGLICYLVGVVVGLAIGWFVGFDAADRSRYKRSGLRANDGGGDG